MLFVFIKEEYQERFLKYSLIFTYLHIAVILVLLLIPTDFLKDHKRYSSVILFTDTNKICQNIAPYDDIYTTGYTSASVLSYHCKKDIKMILNNSKYGRLDDKLLDARELKDKQVVIFFSSKPDIKKLKRVFKDIKIDSFDVNGAKFYLVKASGFDYDSYKKEYLDIQKEKFYHIPKWLPTGRCYFFERYYR